MTSIATLFAIIVCAFISVSQASIFLYEHPYYQGRFITFPGTNVTVYNVPRWLDGKISSLRIEPEPEIPGEEWLLYMHYNLTGPCIRVDNDKSDLGKINWNNRILSLVRVA